MSSASSVAAMRRPYKGEKDAFDIEHLVSKEPFENFRNWFKIACEAEGIMEANAMSLATATKTGRPSVRTVLLKGFDKTGFTFFTNYGSRKGKEMEDNPRVSLLFYWTSIGQYKDWSRQEENPRISLLFHWDVLYRMVRIEGEVEKLTEEESTEYFQSRPKSSQIGTCVSQQSSVIPSRQTLVEARTRLEQQYPDDKQVPKPKDWGGYRVKPDAVEFWQGQTDRVHDRIVFRLPSPGEVIDPNITRQGDDGWVYERLAP